MKMQIKLMCAILLIMAVVFTKCAGKPAKKAPQQPYAVGVIDSANYGTTYLYLLDENLKESETLRCPYHGIGSFGSTPVQFQDGVLYEKWMGNTVKPNKCAVAAMDLQTGEWKDYDFGDGIIKDFRVNEHGIFVLSNNVSPCVDFCSFDGGERVSVEVEDTDGLAISVHGYDVYFIGMEMGQAEDDGAGDKCFLYHVNVKEQSQEKLLDVTEELRENLLEYTLWHEGRMYIPNGDRLSIYEPVENKVRHVALPGKEACQILSDGERLYIVDCDVQNNGETDIYRFHPATEEVEASYHLGESVMQSYIRDGVIYVLQQEPVTKVCKYRLLEDGMCEKVNEAAIQEESDDGHRISDMFVK